MTITTTKFKAKGMHCQSCETLIERAINKIKGIKSVKADYASEIVEVIFETEKTNTADIYHII